MSSIAYLVRVRARARVRVRVRVSPSPNHVVLERVPALQPCAQRRRAARGVAEGLCDLAVLVRARVYG